MQPTTQSESPNTSATATEPTLTAGEVFTDGVLELVSARQGEELQLLLYRNGQQTLAPEIEIKAQRYAPVQLNSSLRRATRFPSHPADPVQVAPKLPSEINKLFDERFGLMLPERSVVTGFSLSTWFPERWWRTPQLVITGGDMDGAMQLLRLLGCVVRHPLLLTGIERASAIAPLMQFHPTLLLNQPGMSSRVLQLLGDSNYRDLSVPGKGGALLQFAGSRAIYLGTNAAEFPAFHISLTAATRPRFLSDLDCQQIANHFQRELLSYRLLHWKKINSAQLSFQSSFGAALPDLQLCVQGDDEFAATLAEAVENQRNDLRTGMASRPEAVLVEILWSPAHASAKLPVKQITRLFNALRRARGERDEYNEMEIGVMLNKLGFPRQRNGAGMVVRFSGDLCRRLHVLAGQFGVNVRKVPECAICSGA